jgi:hypothetical protein
LGGRARRGEKAADCFANRLLVPNHKMPAGVVDDQFHVRDFARGELSRAGNVLNPSSRAEMIIVGAVHRRNQAMATLLGQVPRSVEDGRD